MPIASMHLRIIYRIIRARPPVLAGHRVAGSLPERAREHRRAAALASSPPANRREIKPLRGSPCPTTTYAPTADPRLGRNPAPAPAHENPCFLPTFPRGRAAFLAPTA